MPSPLPSPSRLESARRGPFPWATFAAVLCLGLTLVYAVVNGIVRPTVHSDSGFGFLGWDARDGLPFNYALVPDPLDIARDTATFLATWTPAQHVFPGLLEGLGLSLGLSMVVVTTVFSLLGLAGWWLLYGAFGFPQRSRAVAVILIACSHHYAYPFGIYFGGELMLFAAAPWFLLLVWTLRALRWTAVPALLVGAAAVVFAKLSGIILTAAAIAAAVATPGGARITRDRIRRAIVGGTTVGLIGLLFYAAWYSKGPTAASSAKAIQWSMLPGHLALAISAMMEQSVSIGEIGLYLLTHPGRRLLDSNVPIYAAMLPFALGVFVFVWRRLRESHAEYLRFVLFTGLAVGAVIVWTWVHESEVSVEARHLRIVSLLLLVGIVESVLSTPGRLLRLAFAALALVVSAYGIASAAVHAVANAHRPLGIRGFRHWTAPQPVLDFIRTIDTPQADRRSTLILVPSGEIGLEVRHVRVMSNLADFQPVESLRATVYHGRVPRLYVIIQQRLVTEGKADLVLRSFVDYPRDSWKTIPLGDFVCFYAGD